jgi:hypothetical protein
VELGFSSCEEQEILSSPHHLDQLWVPSCLLSDGYWRQCPREQSGGGLKLATFLHLLPSFTFLKVQCVNEMECKLECYRSSKVTVQGLVFVVQPLYIHTHIQVRMLSVFSLCESGVVRNIDRKLDIVKANV